MSKTKRKRPPMGFGCAEAIWSQSQYAEIDWHNYCKFDGCVCPCHKRKQQEQEPDPEDDSAWQRAVT